MRTLCPMTEPYRRGTFDAQGRERRGVYLPTELWEWVDGIAKRDQASRSDFLEGLVLLAQDAEEGRFGR